MHGANTLAVPKLDRLARSVPDARHITDQLHEKGVKLDLSRNIRDPDDPLGKMFLNILVTFAEFEADLIRMRTSDGTGMVILVSYRESQLVTSRNQKCGGIGIRKCRQAIRKIGKKDSYFVVDRLLIVS